MKPYFCAIVFLSLATTAFSADVVYVQSSKAKIFDSPTFQAPLLATANKGDALTLLETKDQWVKISYQQHTGWVPALLLSNKPPQEKITVIKGQDGGAPQSDARRRASASASAAAARGLRQDQRARASDQDQTNYPAVEKMEANKVNEKDVETFMQEPAK